MKRWQFWLGLAISIVFMYFALNKLKLDEFWLAVKSANYWWILPGIAVYFVGVWVRAWRWHYLLGPIKKIPTRVMFPVTCIGYMGNNIYPARAGEVLRAVVLKRREGVPISASLATVIVERIFDGVVMLAFVFLNLPALAKLSTSDSGFLGNIQSLALIGMGIFVGALVIFLLAAMFPVITLRLGQWLIDHLLPVRIREKTSGIMHKFLDGLASLRSPFNISNGVPHLCSDLAAGNDQILVRDACFQFYCQLLCPHVIERDCQPGDHHPFCTRVYRHMGSGNQGSAGSLWCFRLRGAGIRGGTARGTVAADHPAGSVVHGA